METCRQGQEWLASQRGDVHPSQSQIPDTRRRWELRISKYWKTSFDDFERGSFDPDLNAEWVKLRWPTWGSGRWRRSTTESPRRASGWGTVNCGSFYFGDWYKRIRRQVTLGTLFANIQFQFQTPRDAKRRLSNLQVTPPGVLTQVWWQPPFSTTHSSMSSHSNVSPFNLGEV